MILYHFTAEFHLPMIRKSGVLIPTESNIGSPIAGWPPYGQHVGPDVVWLSSAANIVKGLGIIGFTGDFDKTGVRITVDLPDNEVVKWTKWPYRRRMNKHWRKVMEQDQLPELWWLIERPIHDYEWVDVEVGWRQGDEKVDEAC
jgi:hypothetical protein